VTEENKVMELNKDTAPIVACNLTRLQIAQSIRDFHHKGLWEEEKHFTWLVSIIFSAIIFLITNDKLMPFDKSILVMFVSFIGIIISLIGLKVFIAESINFQIALHRFIIEHNACFIDNKLIIIPRYIDNKTFFRLVYDFIRGRTSIREAFQLLLASFCIIFVACGIIGWIMAFILWRKQ
jgi:hypothetical protein